MGKKARKEHRTRRVWTTDTESCTPTVLPWLQLGERCRRARINAPALLRLRPRLQVAAKLTQQPAAVIRAVPAIPLLRVVATSLGPAVVLGWPQGELLQGRWTVKSQPSPKRFSAWWCLSQVGHEPAASTSNC